MPARRAVILLALFSRVSFSILIILKLPISKPRSREFIIEMYKHKNESEPKMGGIMISQAVKKMYGVFEFVEMQNFASPPTFNKTSTLQSSS